MSSIWRWWCSSKAAISGPCSVAHMKNSFGSCVLRCIVTGSTGRPEGTGGLFIRIAALVLSPAVRGNNRTACTAGAEANTPTKIHSRCRERRKSTPSNPRQKSKERERESMDESGWQIWAQNPKRNWRKSESGPSPGYPIVSLKSFWCALWLLDSDFIREDWRNIDRSGRCRQVGPRRRSTILTQSDANRLVFGSSGKGDTDPPLSLQTDRSKLP